MTETREYDDYSLFDDVEDDLLRTRNRCIVMYNIYDSTTKDGKTNARGTKQLMEYLNMIPQNERADILSGFRIMLENQGTA